MKVPQSDDDLPVRVETDPILSAAVSSTEASGRKLSRFVLSEILSHVGPPLYSEEGPMGESWVGGKTLPIPTPHICGGCGCDFPQILLQSQVTAKPHKRAR